MDLDEFNKSPHVTPLLVKLYDSHKLYGLVKEDKPLARAELTRAVTDLLEAELSAKEQELLADVLIGLMRQAEKDLRQALAERLATYDNVPLRLILHLANDEITVAAPILRKSIVLSDLDLIYITKSQGPDYWQAIAAREKMSDEVIDILAETRDVGTAIVLSQNDRVVLTRHALNVLTDVACEHDEVAAPLLKRSEISEGLARRMYKHVGQELKEYIALFYGIKDEVIETAVNDLILDFAEANPLPKYMPTDTMIMNAEEKLELNMLTMDVMMDTLSKEDGIDKFIAEFAAYTSIPAKKIHGFLRQSCPKGMAIACRAFRVQKNDFAKIYLLTHRMRSKSRMVNQKDMVEVLRYFDKVRPEVAARIVRRTSDSSFA